MRSLAARLTLSAAAWIALGAAAILIIQSEQQLAARHAAVRAFDLHARETVDALADARSAQQAYVAAGQGVAFWMPRVGALVQQTAGSVAGLREAAASADARRLLGLAAVAITDFGSLDQRARDYIRTGESLMAGDVVFTEGAEAAAHGARQVEAARVAEREAVDAEEAGIRKMEASAAGGAAVFAALTLALLGFAPAAVKETAVSIAPAPQPNEFSEIVAHARPRGSAPALRAAAELCTEFGRVNDLPDLTRLLGRAANLMDASGLIVWLGSTAGADLRPVLAHGYSDITLAKIPAVPRNADNAAAAAYRSGALQIVLTRPGTSPGAVVAPLLSPDGCIG